MEDNFCRGRTGQCCMTVIFHSFHLVSEQKSNSNDSDVLDNNCGFNLCTYLYSKLFPALLSYFVR